MDPIKKMLEDIANGVNATRDQITKMGERVGALETGFKERAIGIPGVELEKDKFSFARAIYAIATKDWSVAPFEDAVFKETKKRAIAAGTDSAGGFLVPTQFMAELIDLLRAKTVVLEMGATEMLNLSGSPVEIPRQSAGATATYIAENSVIPESEQTFEQLNLTPKQLSALVRVSNRSLRLSNPGIEGIVRNDLAKVLARRADLAGLRGTGAASEPLGIVNTIGIGSVSAGSPNGGAVSYDLLADLINELEENDALDGKLGFVFHPRIKRQLTKLKDSDGRPLFTWDPSKTQPASMLLGYPWMTTTQLPTNLVEGAGTNLSEIIFANWEELIWGGWGNLSLAASQEASDAFSRNQTFIRAILEHDIQVRHAESFAVSPDVISS